MKTRLRFSWALAAAVLLLLAALTFWPAASGGLHAGRSANAAPAALTPEQNAAIQAANLLLLGSTFQNQAYLPRINR
jgi:hypothetical protein